MTSNQSVCAPNLKPNCLLPSDLNSYYNKFFTELVDAYRPSLEHELISVDVDWSAISDNPLHFSNHWSAFLTYGISQNCCACCC
jgi:hypothetical protein